MYLRLPKLSKNNSFFLFGARASGKSTLLQEMFAADEAIRIDLLDAPTMHELSAYPHRLKERLLPEKGKKSWVVIDEVQKIPPLLDVVHQLLFEKAFKFALTGSSARKLRRGSANMLAGRAFVYHLFPLTFMELGDKFDLSRALQFGTLPECWDLATGYEREKYLISYALSYVHEEVIAEQLVRNHPPFRRFLEVAAQQDGEILSYTNIAKDVGIDAKSVSQYYDILEDTLLGFRLPSFHRSIRKRQKKAPKFYFFDTGVMRALAGQVTESLNVKSVEYGKVFETFVINEIHRLLTYAEKQFRLSYIRVDERQEIDLIVERGKKVVCICEIKASAHVDERAAQNLDLFGASFPGAERLVISNDPVPKDFSGVSALPWQSAITRILDSFG